MAKSFYDLDWWIELNVKKDETLRAEYDKVLGRVSNIVIIYSAFSVFLLAIWKDAFKTKMFYQHFFQNINPWYFCFIVLFFGLLATSFFNTIRFLLPKDNPSLEPPKKYYSETRAELEAQYATPNGKVDEEKINKILKAAYITELEDAIDTSTYILDRKKGFYFRAFKFAIFSIFPFIFCLVFHTFQEDKPTQVEVVNSGKNRIFISDTLKVQTIGPTVDTVQKTKKNGNPNGKR